MGYHDHRGHVPQEVQLSMFNFVNTSIESDLVDEKTGKVLAYRVINCCEENEEAARKKSARGKLDPDGKLSSEYKLIKVTELNKYWRK